MRNFRKLSLICATGGILIALLLLSQVPSANANFPEITFSPFCETVSLTATQPLAISAIPNWSHPAVASQVIYVLYRGGAFSGDAVVTTSIFRPNTFSTTLSDMQTPTGEYNHFAEYAPFQGRIGPFWVDRGSQF